MVKYFVGLMLLALVCASPSNAAAKKDKVKPASPPSIDDIIADTVVPRDTVQPAMAVQVIEREAPVDVPAGFKATKGAIPQTLAWKYRSDDTRYNSLDDMVKAFSDRDEQTTRKRGDFSDLHADSDGENGVIWHYRDKPVTLTNHAASQIFAKASMPQRYIAELPGRLAAPLINHGLHSIGAIENSVLLTGDSVRAVTGDTYGVYPDSRFARDMQVVAGEMGLVQPTAWSGERTGLFSSDRDVTIGLIDSDSASIAIPSQRGGKDQSKTAELHRGVIARGSEVGGIGQEFLLVLFAFICGNLMIHGASKGFRKVVRHTRHSGPRIAEAIAGIKEFFAGSDLEAERDRLVAMQGFELPTDLAILADQIRASSGKTAVQQIGKKEALSIIDLAMSEEGECHSLYQLHQGATAYARDFKNVDLTVDFLLKENIMVNNMLATA